MNLFVDTNVILDVLAQREPHYADSVAVWSLAETGQVQAFISAVSMTNIFYIVRKLNSAAEAHRCLHILRDVFRLAPCDAQIIHQAIDADMPDFEDAVQYYSATHSQAACLITRNPKHFKTSQLAISTPVEFMLRWRELKKGSLDADQA